jgi:hypothetical protein
MSVLNNDLILMMICTRAISVMQVMGGVNSPYFEKYVNLTTEAFKVARKHTSDIISLMEIMSHKSCYPAFRSAFQPSPYHHPLNIVLLPSVKRRSAIDVIN